MLQPEAGIGRKAQRQEYVFLILEIERKLEILEWSDCRELGGGGGSGEMEAGKNSGGKHWLVAIDDHQSSKAFRQISILFHRQ